MKIHYLLTFTLLFIFYACQTAKNIEDDDDNKTDIKAQQMAQWRQDSLQRVFCDCLVEDSISNEERLNKIDNFLSQGTDINIPCRLEEEAFSSAGTFLLNAGISLSNRILRTNFKKKSSKVRTVTKIYPVLMLFSEDTTMVRELVGSGANLDTKTSDMVSLPSYYVSQDDLEKLQFTLALGANTSEIELYTSNEKMIAFLLEKGAKAEKIDKITLFEKDNYKELAEKYNVDLSKTTCEEFKNIVEVTNFRKINFERTQWLLSNGVNASCINGKFLESIINEDFDGKIYSASKTPKPNQHTQNEWVEMVSKYKVNWNQCSNFGKTPLLLAVEKRETDLIKTLLKEGADPNFACEFAGKRRTVQDALTKTKEYAEQNEQRKKEREGDKYSDKDAKKHTAYMQTLEEIRILLETK